MADDIIRIRQPVNQVHISETPNEVLISSSGPQGPEGEEGPPGAPGGAAYTHTQAVAASQWNINHGLGKRPHVTLIGTDSAKFIGRVEYVDDNNVAIVLNQPVAGIAELS